MSTAHGASSRQIEPGRVWRVSSGLLSPRRKHALALVEEPIQRRRLLTSPEVSRLNQVARPPLCDRLGLGSMSVRGTFETCRLTLRMSANRGGPEVIGARSK